jgi:hypothetical protein
MKHFKQAFWPKSSVREQSGRNILHREQSGRNILHMFRGKSLPDGGDKLRTTIQGDKARLFKLRATLVKARTQFQR